MEKNNINDQFQQCVYQKTKANLVKYKNSNSVRNGIGTILMKLIFMNK